MIPKEELQNSINESFKRSETFGILPDTLFPLKSISTKELSDILLHNSELCEHAKSVIQNLSHSLNKNIPIVAILTNSEGIVLSVERINQLNESTNCLELKKGTIVSETYAGCNAIALAIIKKQCFELHGNQNYAKAIQHLDITSAPIINYNNRLIGTFSLATTNGGSNNNFSALAIMTANAIAERLWNNLIQKQLNNERQYAFNIINNLTYGLFAINLEHKIYWVNDTACRTLNIRRTLLLNKDIAEYIPNWLEIKKQLDGDKTITDEEQDIIFPFSEEKFLVNAHSIKGFNGQVLGYVITIRPLSRMMKIIGHYSSNNAYFTFKDILGQSDAMKYAISMAKTAARSPSTILITGASGTGKEVFAQAIHNSSTRKGNNFVAINCGAISSTLIESELFGYEEGAFTGALKKGKPGKFELANNGTIFLDEIGDMPHEMQVKLLRAIQEKKIIKVGGTKEIPIDVRIIAATNKDLSTEIKKGTFRSDLYYRLSVIPIQLPALHQRSEDIPVLIRFFLKQKSQLLNKPIPEIDEHSLQRLKEYQWPGNVRELENIVEKIVLFQGQTAIRDLLPGNTNESAITVNQQAKASTNSVEPLLVSEKRIIENALTELNWNIANTAKALGIGRNTLYEKIKKHRIIPKEQ
jgi:sigma-54 dependent transcriptional regulator, acetoin dehydrogenase operon transcriptional activator AcoR